MGTLKHKIEAFVYAAAGGNSPINRLELAVEHELVVDACNLSKIMKVWELLGILRQWRLYDCRNDKSKVK